MTFVDANVILDIFTDDKHWASWSGRQLAAASDRGAVFINPIVLAELSPSFGALAPLETEIAALCIEIDPLSEIVAFAAGRRFVDYRRTRDTAVGRRVLPDFFIGAHALELGAPLLTRDAGLCRRYFPELPLITPA